jgi:hypothetical protein
MKKKLWELSGLDRTLWHREFGHDLHARLVSTHVRLVDAQKISNAYF